MQKLSDLLKQKYQNSEKDIVLDGADFISQKGYTLIPNYVLLTKGLSTYAKVVYAVLLSYAWGEKNNSFPGQVALGSDCGLSERSVRSAIRELEDKEFITVIQRGLGKTNVYVLHFKKK
jgi:hypothetical protein